MAVTSQDRQPVFGSSSQDQRVIQDPAPVRGAITLKTRHYSRENSSNQPDLTVRRDCAVRRPLFDNRGDLFYRLGGAGVGGVEETAGCDQFSFRNC